MIKKADLRSVFERIVTTKKFLGPNNSIPINNFRIVIESLGRSFQILLQASCIAVCYNTSGDYTRSVSWCTISKSFPFHSYKSAYQFLVRL